MPLRPAGLRPDLQVQARHLASLIEGVGQRVARAHRERHRRVERPLAAVQHQPGEDGHDALALGRLRDRALLEQLPPGDGAVEGGHGADQQAPVLAEILVAEGDRVGSLLLRRQLGPGGRRQAHGASGTAGRRPAHLRCCARSAAISPAPPWRGRPGGEAW